MVNISDDVKRALDGLHSALYALNAADGQYAQESDGPYGTVKRAILEVLRIAAPEVSGGKVIRVAVDNDMSISRALGYVVEETASRESEYFEALRVADGVTDVVVRRYAPHWSGATAAPHFTVNFTNGAQLSIIPDDGRVGRWLDYGGWEAIVFDGDHGSQVTLPGHQSAIRGDSLSGLLEIVEQINERL